MHTYIALFRGINVGGKNMLPMKELVHVLERFGCEQVKNYIQSGNVVFQSRENLSHSFADVIGSDIAETHGFKPKVFLLGLDELQAALANNPFSTEDGKALHFFFLDAVPSHPDWETLAAVQSKSEQFKVIGKVCYLYAPDGIGRSKLASKIEGCLGVPVTARNWNTMQELISMATELNQHSRI
ncbi:DUF1697 domain-containing protein [Geomesophilobacter sediminis]|uniref:DUF1697 domain-containing protein n=1 Tax=Geomesophilobacter sediminis TaxID=2798584 RepID=A0A8J7J778_9BACT|nr:DUF1697 domain-containing protein [Geomesophilobacter sediminis]MBJ6724931.1 DUF1697 domain-containing protein [Geomesophilobacter sediminis]